MREIILPAIISFVAGFLVGFVTTQSYITTGAFYKELRKRALTSSDFICSEAKEAKFLYDTYNIK